MSEMFTIFSQICLPIIMVVGLGWILDKAFKLELKTLIKLNLYLFVPSFIFVRFFESELPGALGARIMLFTACVAASMALVSWVVSLVKGYPRAQRAELQLSTMLYNSGNWGLPLMSLAFPANGGVVQVFVLLTMNLTSFTVGILLANSAGTSGLSGWKKLLPVLRQPSIYALLAAILARVSDSPVDEIIWIWKPLSYLADALIGIALVTLGVQLSKTRPPKPVGRLAWSLLIRLVAGPAVGAALAIFLFDFPTEFVAILIVGAASPTAVNAALITAEFKADSRFTASAVYYSTLLSVFVVTLLIMLLRT